MSGSSRPTTLAAGGDAARARIEFSKGAEDRGYDECAHRIQRQDNPNIPDFGPGDRVKVSAKVVEGDRERIQVFEGDVIRVRNGGPASTFTVRKISSGIGVERTFQRHSPRVEKVEVVRRGKVRRARLYYLRDLRGRAARIKEKRRD